MQVPGKFFEYNSFHSKYIANTTTAFTFRHKFVRTWNHLWSKENLLLP